MATEGQATTGRTMRERRNRGREAEDDVFWAGYRAGLAGRPSAPAPAGCDELAWLAGWIEGDAERRPSRR